MTTAIVWFRRDLRLADNAALAHALATAERVIPLYIHEPAELGAWAPGAASNWWLHHSLAALTRSLEQRGTRLVIRRAASALAGLRAAIKDSGATLVCWNRLYEPAKYRHAPWEASEAVLAAAGVSLGQDYPRPVLDLVTERAAALAAFRDMPATATK